MGVLACNAEFCLKTENMNAINVTGSRLKSITAVLFLCILIFSSCARKINFAISDVVPAANGMVKLKKDKNNNYLINLQIEHLANPERLQPSKKYYVVWMETEDHGTKNIGRLKSSSGLLSGTLKASLKTVTSYTPASIFITAENNPDVQYPGTQVILRTQDF